MGKGRRKTARQVSEALAATPGPVIIGRHAEAELFVAEPITKQLERIARAPTTRAPEPHVPGLPAGAVARKATVSGHTIRWVYPFIVDGEPNVLVVSIRRGSRKALEDPEYLLRWLEERARQRP